MNDIKRSMELDSLVRSEIQAGGPMTFARFMELALYHDPLGYYCATPMATTRRGDFLTAPETHPVFGALLARFAFAAANGLNVPGFTVVEQGAGTGSLAASVVNYWRAAYPDATLRYVIVEPFAPASARLIAHLGDRAVVVEKIEEIGQFKGMYLSNELPDAFPVHRVRMVSGQLVEVYVALDEGRLVEITAPPSTLPLAAWLAMAGVDLTEGHELEVSLQIEPWLTRVSSRIQRGFVLTIDYGYTSAEAPRFPRATMLAHFGHTANEDYLERIGRQDLTSHVCWSAVERFGEEAGMRTMERMTQRDFLTRWGWKDYGRWLIRQDRASHVELDAVDRLGRQADGMGGFGVLLQAKGDVAMPDAERAGPPQWDAVGY
jgi:SAM-dependent MidA family methyltransferase